MPVYELQKAGKTYEIDAPNPQAASQALDRIQQETSTPTRSRGLATIGEMVGDVAIGAGKGAASTAVGLGRLVHKIPGVDRALGPIPADATTTLGLDPTNTAQKVGYGLEQVAEVVLPMGVVSKATKGARLATRMAAEGASMAGIAKAQGGDPVTAGVIGAAVPAVGAALSKVPASLRESAYKKVAQALGATKERFKAIAEKRAPEILRRGLGGTRAQLLADATAHAKEAGRAVDDVLKIAGDQRVPTGPVVDALEEAKGAFQQVRKVSLADAVKGNLLQTPGAKVVGQSVELPVVLDARPIEQLTKLQQTIRELGDDASVEQLTAARRVWDDVVARAGGFAHRQGSAFGVPLAEQTEAWAKREATKAIRKALTAEVPDLAKVNAEFSFWKDLKDVLTATQKRTQAQGPGLQRIIYGTMGAGAGYSSGGKIEDRLKGAVVGGLLAPKVLSKLTSAEWRFVSAKLRNALADAIASESPGLVAAAVTRIAAVAGSKGVARVQTSEPIGTR